MPSFLATLPIASLLTYAPQINQNTAGMSAQIDVTHQETDVPRQLDRDALDAAPHGFDGPPLTTARELKP
jgi:hypothetical protein